jgi:hypothetical protein
MLFVNPWPPYQCTTCFGSVKAVHTSSRGASNMRVMTMTGSFAELASTLAFIRASLRYSCAGGREWTELRPVASVFPLRVLDIFEMLGQTIEAPVPETSIAFQPFENRTHRVGFKMAWAPLRIATTGNQAGCFQDFQMLRHRREAHLIRLCQLLHRRVASRKAGQDPPSCGISQGE